MEPITLSSTLTEEDYIRSYRLFAHRKMNYCVAMSFYFGIAFLPIIIFWAFRRNYFRELTDWAPFVLAVVGFVAFLFFERFQAKRQIRKNRQVTLPVSMRFSEQGVLVKNDMTETNYTWPYFRGVYENAEFFYLTLAQNPKVFLFVPKRLFEAPEQLESLRALCKQQLSLREATV
ncbi:MAG: YcxB family protein [Anaerolineaceae bacterium]|nr:YcxB family protein [Anaerolineaceae bacterium]